MSRQAKTLDDIKFDMSVLYDRLNSGSIKIETASELANIAGKFLKAEQLMLARQIFSGQLERMSQPSPVIELKKTS